MREEDTSGLSNDSAKKSESARTIEGEVESKEGSRQP